MEPNRPTDDGNAPANKRQAPRLLQRLAQQQKEKDEEDAFNDSSAKKKLHYNNNVASRIMFITIILYNRILKELNIIISKAHLKFTQVSTNQTFLYFLLLWPGFNTVYERPGKSWNLPIISFRPGNSYKIIEFA